MTANCEIFDIANTESLTARLDIVTKKLDILSTVTKNPPEYDENNVVAGDGMTTLTLSPSSLNITTDGDSVTIDGTTWQSILDRIAALEAFHP